MAEAEAVLRDCAVEVFLVGRGVRRAGGSAVGSPKATFDCLCGLPLDCPS